LVPGGMVLNHGITHNQLGAAALGSGIGDFVEEYVFPGGELAHISKVIEGAAAQGLEAVDAEALREHYAKTLWKWVERLEANADAARAEVGDERYRIWRIYLAGSAHAFDRGWLSLWQMLAGKPYADGRLPHPLTREYMYGPRRPAIGATNSETPPNGTRAIAGAAPTAEGASATGAGS
ncbi:MAG: class I SAM-dependent methyltransferase, partial [Casimicrobiaceae bacterium]